MTKVRKCRFVLLVVILCLSAFGFSNSEYLTKEYELLEKYAQYFSVNVNTNVDQCHDFASYVKDGFDVSKVNEFGYKNIKSVYDSFIAAGVVLSRADGKAKEFYESCMEHLPETYLDAITELNIARRVLEFRTLDKFGPTVYGKYNTAFSWSKLVGVLQNYDVTAFVAGYATRPASKPVRFHLGPGKFDLTQTEFWNGDMKSVLQYYGLGESEIFDLIRSLEEFERKFSDRETTKVKSNMTIGDLQTKFPDFEWIDYFGTVGNTEYLNDEREVTVTDLEKIEEYYHVHNFPELTETAVAYYFLKLHAKLNMEYYAVKNDKRMCLIKTFNLFKEVFANIVLQNLNEQDDANLRDTIVSVMYAVSKLANWDTRWAIDASMNEAKNEPSIATQQKEYKEYVSTGFTFITENEYLTNYLRAYSFYRNRQMSSWYQKYLDRIGFYYNVHEKPRLVLLATVGYQVAYGTIKQYNVRIKQIAREHCQAFFDGIAPYRAVLDAVDYLEEQDPEKYQNEVAALKNYHFDPKKIVHFLYGKILVEQNKGTDRSVLSKVFLQVQDFRKSYGCSAPSELSHGCYV